MHGPRRDDALLPFDWYNRNGEIHRSDPRDGLDGRRDRWHRRWHVDDGQGPAERHERGALCPYLLVNHAR